MQRREHLPVNDPTAPARCANCPGCRRRHIWRVALCSGPRVLAWTDIRTQTWLETEAQARAAGMFEGAAVYDLDVAILSDVVPRSAGELLDGFN